MAAFALASCSGSAEQAAQKAAVAQQQLDRGQIRAARQSIADAIAERDDLVSLYLLRGRIEYAANNIGAAFQAYQAALGLDPANAEALQGVAQLGLRTGQLSESQEAAERILNLQPNQVDALVVIGVINLARSRAKDALEVADRIIAQDSANEAGVILKARALFLDKRGDEALKSVRDREREFGRTELTALTALELLRERHDARGMLGEFAFLRTARPNDLGMRIDEANLRYKTGDRPGARSLLTVVLANPKASQDQLKALGGLWREYDPAPLSAADRASLARRPTPQRVFVAKQYLRLRQANLAAAVLGRPEGAEAVGVSARIAAALGETQRARAIADRVLADDETQCDALIGRAVATQSGEAVELAQRAVAECPQEAEAALALANAYAKVGDRAGAWRSFSDAVVRIPQDSALSTTFRQWLDLQGRHREATGEARRLTRKAPALLSAWRSYLEACSADPRENCESAARAGLDRAKTLFAIDNPPGKLDDKGLTGRLQRR